MDTIGTPRVVKLTNYRDVGAKAPAPMAIKSISDMSVDELAAELRPPEVSPQRAAGFNYGMGNPAAAKTPLYAEADAIATRLREASTLASNAAWKGEMILRELRIAETDAEKLTALEHLRAWVLANDPRDSKGDPRPNYTFAEIAAIPEREARATDPELIYGVTI